MATKILLLVTLVIVKSSHQDVADNDIDDVVIDQAKADIYKEQNAQNIGGMLNNLLQSEGAKQLGDMLANAAGENGGQILQGLGSMLGQKESKGFDPSLLTMAMSMLQAGQNKKSQGEGFDVGSLLSLLGSLGEQGGEGGGLMSYLPLLMQTVGSFMGPEAYERAKAHIGHDDLMPAYLEKIHLYFDLFVNSELGKKLIENIGGEKFARIFKDESGRFSYRKFVDMLENHSFRRHWISMITEKIAKAAAFIGDFQNHKKYLTTFQHFINSVLKSQNFPKSALFDANRPVETISNMVNHLSKVYLNMKVDSKQYVKPTVDYIQTVLKLAQKKGIMNVDERELSNKLADTINMEVIEPIARVNRAYRFALKVPKCDKYVMCLVNREEPDENLSLPGLKKGLSRSASLILGWFLSTNTGTSFWSLYRVIMEEKNCQALFLEACNGFHLEEIKVTTEYVHNEL